LTRLSAFAVAADMVGAILLFHMKNGFFVPGGIEFPMMLSASALALLALGAGSLSVDRAIDQRRSRT
jgi:putative oxidoreductase